MVPQTLQRGSGQCVGVPNPKPPAAMFIAHTRRLYSLFGVSTPKAKM